MSSELYGEEMSVSASNSAAGSFGKVAVSYRAVFRGIGLSGIVLLVAVCTGCGVQGIRPDSDSEAGRPLHDLERSLLEEELTRQDASVEVPTTSLANYSFMRGELAFADENYGEALRYYSEAEKFDPQAGPTLSKRIAQIHVRAGRLDDALQSLERALTNDADDVEALQLKAGILATRRQTKEAIETYERIIVLGDSTNEEPYVLIASLYAQEGDLPAAKAILKRLISKNADSFFGHYYLARMSEAEGDVKGAEEGYRKSLQLNSNAESVRVDLARVLGAQKRFPEAIELCTAVIESNPKNVTARNMLAQLLLGENKLDQAIEQFESLGKLEEDPSDTRFKIALIKIQRRDFEAAITDLNLILAEHPENTAARYYLGSAYAGVRKFGDAISELRKIGAGEELFVESRILGAAMLQQEKRYAEASDIVGEAISEKPSDIRLLSLQASLDHESGNFSRAVNTMKKVVELEPTKDANYFSLGVYQDAAGQRDDAIASMKKTIELNPKNANALNYLGYTYADSGKSLEEAEQLVRRALTIEKDNGYFIDSLGWVYYKMGRFKDALKELERSVELVPNDAVILEHYAQVLYKLQQRGKAVETAKKALTFAPNSDDKGVGERLNVLIHELERK